MKTYYEKELVKSLKAQGLKVTHEKRFYYGWWKFFTVDICIEKLKLVIEVDGRQHFQDADQMRRDDKRDEGIRKKGYKVKRISNKDISSFQDRLAFCRAIAGRSKPNYKKREN